MANPPDPSNVKLLCHFNGSDGQTTTTDSSLNARTLTANSTYGGVLSTAQSKFGGASLALGGVNGSAVPYSGFFAADSDDFAFGAGQFTIESWAYFAAAPGGSVLSIMQQWGSAPNLGFFFGMVSGALAFYYSTTGSDNPNVGAAWTPTLNTWYHIAVDRDASNVLRVYVDGAVLASATVASTLFNSNLAVVAGGLSSSWPGINGYVDDLRVVKGEAVYGGAFTRPAAALPDPVLTMAQRIAGMDWAFAGQPFVQVAKSGIDTSTLDVAQDGQPFSASYVLASSGSAASGSTRQAQTVTATGSTGVNATVATSQGQRATATAALAANATAATAQAQTVGATATLGADTTASTGQAQSVAGALASSEGATQAFTAQAQSVAALGEVRSDMTAATSQAQSVAAVAAVGVGATASTAQAQSITATAVVAAAVSVATRQGQSASATGQIAVDAVITTSQAQSTTASTAQELVCSVATGQAQGSIAAASVAVAALAGTAQAGQAAQAQGQVSTDALAATAQGQSASAAAALSASASVATAQAQRVAATGQSGSDSQSSSSQAQSSRGDLLAISDGQGVQTYQAGQTVQASGELSVAFAVETQQGQVTIASLGVAMDSSATTAQAQGTHGVIVAGVDGIASTGQAGQSVHGSIIEFVQQVGAIAVGQISVRQAVSGQFGMALAVQVHSCLRQRQAVNGRVGMTASVQAHSRIRPVLAAYTNLRPAQ
jgi:hypothetical protein